MKATINSISILFLLLCVYNNSNASKINNLKNIKEVLIPKNVNDSIIKIDYTNYNILLKNHVSNLGIVNYKGFIKDKKIFISFLSELSKNTPNPTWSKEKKIAYWMNVYNAFTIKLIIDNYPLKSIKEIKKPWDLLFIKIGKKHYSLNDIEHHILRKMNDSRIHFGINCASYSCPPLQNKAFRELTVNEDLDTLTSQFINDKNRNIISEQSIILSKIFKWFSKDFKKDGNLINYLNKYSNIRIESSAKKSFKNYNWSLNE
jgi:hypothetical protein